MPRRKTVVNIKHVQSERSSGHARSGKKPVSQPLLLGSSLGAVDLHFHGAFGIDLMTAKADELDDLARKLWCSGVAAFCPTTLSDTPEALLETVTRLGAWISHQNRSRLPKVPQQALPLGIHLEGPFIHPEAKGAHPAQVIRPATSEELELLWQASHKTLRIITLAPETLNLAECRKIIRWAQQRNITLSLGHSRATEEQAAQAFDLGFKGVTHAWNALPYHHRSPGPLGAALGRKDVYVELIIDRLHVHPTLIRWTRNLHPTKKICFVSDCAPATETAGNWCSFGPLQVRLHQGACRLENGALAGGGILLPSAYCRWLETESTLQKTSIKELFLKTIPSLTTAPLQALGLSPSLIKRHRIHWKRGPSGHYDAKPLG